MKSAFDFPDLDTAANAPPSTGKAWCSSSSGGGGAANGSSSSGLGSGGGLSGMGGSSSGGGERPKLNLAKSTVDRVRSAPASSGPGLAASEVCSCLRAL